MKRIAILGSTGSIGVSTLDVIARHPDRFEVVALCARSNAQVRDRLNAANVGTEVLSSPGDIALMAALPEVDMVMAAIVGAAGLPAVLAAACAGKTILLANKEALVMSGPLFVTTTVYVVLPAAVTVETPSVFEIPRSASGCTLSVSLAVLLPGVGSVVPAGGATETVLVTEPLVAVTLAEMVKVTVPPTGSVGMITPVDSSRTTVTLGIFSLVRSCAVPICEAFNKWPPSCIPSR